VVDSCEHSNPLGSTNCCVAEQLLAVSRMTHLHEAVTESVLKLKILITQCLLVHFYLNNL
jgi:hypothetical protein